MKSSREQFEAWFPAMVDGMPENMVKVFDEMLFTAWQASRSAIEIELPKYHELTTQDTISARAEKSTYNFGIYDSADAIRAAGITVKGDA